jgi:chromosomal replication initiation ATPase DnaA
MAFPSRIAEAVMSTLRWKVERYDRDILDLTRQFRLAAAVQTRAGVLEGLMAQAIPSDVREIVRAVALEYGVKPEHIMSRRRVSRLGPIRHEAMFRIYQETGMSAAAIARHFQRDHTTVLYALKQAAVRRGRAA